ncbi:hypothetical protein [Yoonia sp. F2084L]|uniref:hypothetical protein n=1 Tax=Yoonia sp. F2084L TaxID=2926419 RepID=UPI001FF4A6E0|nr:hypothetical protein [Yoonia sp. F2084L]
MTMTNPNDDMLDDLFAQARGVDPTPSNDLMTRVLTDADAVQPKPVVRPDTRPGFWVRLVDAVGGWPAVSGLAAATIAGLWVGVAPPASVSDLTATLIGDEVSISLFSTELMLDEGVFSDG